MISVVVAGEERSVSMVPASFSRAIEEEAKMKVTIRRIMQSTLGTMKTAVFISGL